MCLPSTPASTTSSHMPPPPQETLGHIGSDGRAVKDEKTLKDTDENHFMKNDLILFLFMLGAEFETLLEVQAEDPGGISCGFTVIL